MGPRGPIGPIGSTGPHGPKGENGFVGIDGERSIVKILSSGLVYSTVDALRDGGWVQLKQLPARGINDFWTDAKLSIGDDFKTKIIDHQDGWLRVENDLALVDSASVTLDAGLVSPVLATRIGLGIPITRPLPPLDLRLGTTRGTNALLTRSGARTGLMTTVGFADLTRIGEQNRRDLFALHFRQPLPLAERIVEVTARRDHLGEVLTPLSELEVIERLSDLKADGMQSIAVALLHSHIDPTDELVIGAKAREMGFEFVSLSHQVAPEIRLLHRSDTTTLDAYLQPVLKDYLEQLTRELGSDSSIKLMTSGGNLVQPYLYRGRDSVLSGPAGGVISLASIADEHSQDIELSGGYIGLDMGGTSTDVSRFDGVPGRRHESEIDGIRLLAPMMDIHTVAAGGGSICDVVDGRMCVGPESAGASPGPACYGRGGPLCVTDLNVILGRLLVDRFPFALDVNAALDRLSDVRTKMRVDGSGHQESWSDEDLAKGFLKIAVTQMAEAVRRVSLAEGYDPAEMTLVGFGGAAGLHLCDVARTLGMKRILDHPHSSMLSALGMGLARLGTIQSRGVRLIVPKQNDELVGVVDELTAAGKTKMGSHGCDVVKHAITLDMRYRGTQTPLSLSIEEPSKAKARFETEHLRLFGFHQETEVEVIAVRVETTENLDDDSNALAWVGDDSLQSALESTRRRHDRDSCRPGDRIAGESMIVGARSTLWVESGWQAEVLDGPLAGTIELKFLPLPDNLPSPWEGRTFQQPGRETRSKRGEIKSQRSHSKGFPTMPPQEGSTPESEDIESPVHVEVIARRLQGIADAGGEVLRRTATSVNVKERRDYSCGVFDARGNLIAGALHVPVHLGAMGGAVRAMVDKFEYMNNGDHFVTNHPKYGGSHLPDVTLVTPVFIQPTDAGNPDLFVASRAHHAEIGGIVPGSMPPSASCLAEEGVVLDGLPLFQSGKDMRQAIRAALAQNEFPSRDVDANMADLSAQVAAANECTKLLRQLAETTPVKSLQRTMGSILDLADRQCRRWIATVAEAPVHLVDHIDDGTPIGVRVSRNKEQGRLNLRFDATPVHQGGFNAPPSITRAAVMYAIRCLCGSDLPLCDGVLESVDIEIPEGMLNPIFDADPRRCPPIVAGNVETSQRLVDVLLAALGGSVGGVAASQGTMNNVIFGNNRFGYYETLGGGCGATKDGPGCDAVHSHMTNTRITDPEIVESELPVRLKRFAIRHGSGGRGTHRGGDGLIREYQFLEDDLTLTLLTGRRESG
ncbi:MAG: hydantoinase B/oxoprolinase family protein, partial [Planctomycetota bacterium]